MIQAPRKVTPEQLARMIEVFDRRAQLQRMMGQLTDEVRTAFICLGIDTTKEELDLSTGEVLPMAQPVERAEEAVVPGVNVNGRS